MDIVNFWAKQVAIWQEEKKCGMCWEFGAPLKTSAMNVQQAEKGSECCTNVFLTDIKLAQKVGYNQTTGFVNSKSCEWNFNLYIVMQSEIGKNNYNEIKGYPIDDSNWEKIFKPIIDCVGCDVIPDYCEILGYPIDVASWSAETVHQYQDMNYSGWKINMTFRDKK